eukprot:1879529-Alexandrium_andersonii.AAC.1
MREAVANLSPGGAMPGPFVRAVLQRAVIRGLLAGLPGAPGPGPPLLAFALTRAVSIAHAPVPCSTTWLPICEEKWQSAGCR